MSKCQNLILNVLMSFRRFVIWSLSLSYFFLFWVYSSVLLLFYLWDNIFSFCPIQNTFPFIGLHARARHDPHQSTDEACSAPVHPRKKNCMGRGQTDWETDFATTRPTRPRGLSWWKMAVVGKLYVLPALISGYKIYYKLYTDFCIQFSLNHKISQFCMISL